MLNTPLQLMSQVSKVSKRRFEVFGTSKADRRE